MNDKLAQEILTMHIEVLNEGTDVTETLARRYPDIAPLLGLAQTIHQKMALKEASPEFVQRLYAELLGSVRVEQPEAVTHRTSNNWVIGAAVGSAMTGLAAMMWARRASSSRGQSALA